MDKLQDHARDALAVLRHGSDRLPQSYHTLLQPPLSGLLGIVLDDGVGLSAEQHAVFREISAVCGWNDHAYLLLRVPGVKWPPLANVPPDLAHDPERFGRLRAALEILAGDPELEPTESMKPSEQADNKTDNEKKSKKFLPDDPDVLRLAKKIKSELPKGGTKRDIALDFTGGDEKRAISLLKQLQPSRYGHLLE